MTATTLTRLPLMAGSAVATTLGRAGLWTLSKYMRAPLASTGLLAMVTLTALASSNALYFQTARHPHPFFGPAVDVPQPVAGTPEIAPIPEQQQRVAAPQVVTNETTGSVAPIAAPQVIPDSPVGNADAFNVQKKLFELGLFQGKVDGFYGPMTARAIRAFEDRNNLEPTGALTPDVIDAILRADAQGLVPVAQQAVVAPAPVVQQAAVVAPPPAPVVQADRVVAVLPAISPVDAAVDTVGSAAAQTLDGIIAAVDGGRTAPVTQAGAPTPAMPMLASSAQPMPAAVPAPVQVASLEPMAAPQAAVPAVAAVNNVQLVSQIQRGLASLGFYRGSIDGHPGDSTARAIREFENFHSYKVTGQINPDLVGLLRDAGASL